MLLHNQLYRNLFDFVKEDHHSSNQVERGENESNANSPQSTLVSKTVKQSKSVQLPEKKPISLARFGTFEFPNEKNNYIDSRKFNLMDLFKNYDVVREKESSTSDDFPFGNFLYSQQRTIRGNKRVHTHIQKVKKGVEYSLYYLKQLPSNQAFYSGKTALLKDVPSLPIGR